MTLTPRSRRHLAGLATAALLLAACGTSDPAGTTTEGVVESVSESPDDTDETGGDDAGDPDDAAGTSDDMDDDTEAAAEGSTPASGVVAIAATTPDGTTVSPADFAGTPVFVETFATWCSNCRSQLGSTQQAAAEVGDDAVFLALSVETDLDPAALATYAADNGFANIRFGVLSAQDLATLEAEFGNAVLVPPSTPKFTIAADGTLSALTTGFESVDEILAQL